jgi:hypothetical protein
VARLAVLVVVGLALLVSVPTAESQVHVFFGGVKVAIRGWGSVEPGRGFDDHSLISCTKGHCGPSLARARAPHVTLIARAYKGWKFAGWSVACKGKQRTCATDLSRFHADSFGEHIPLLKARFVPVAAGLTRAHPIPFGHTANLGGFWKLRINSTTANVALSPAAPAGDEYFAVNVTATWSGSFTGSLYSLVPLVEGNRNVEYGQDRGPNGGGCPGGGPPPLLAQTLPYGEIGDQSTTGNFCWLIAADDETSLKLNIGTLPKIWFALH